MTMGLFLVVALLPVVLSTGCTQHTFLDAQNQFNRPAQVSNANWAERFHVDLPPINCPGASIAVEIKGTWESADNDPILAISDGHHNIACERADNVAHGGWFYHWTNQVFNGGHFYVSGGPGGKQDYTCRIINDVANDQTVATILLEDGGGWTAPPHAGAIDTTKPLRATLYHHQAAEQYGVYEMNVELCCPACHPVHEVVPITSYDGQCTELPNTLNMGSTYSVHADILLPLPARMNWATLLRSAVEAGPKHHHILVQQGSDLLGVYKDGWYPSTLNINSLSPGWHNLQVIYKPDSTTFIVDGCSTYVVNVGGLDGIKFIGCTATGNSQYWMGKVKDMAIYTCEYEDLDRFKPCDDGEGVIRGDPHFRTFDGLLHHFQGLEGLWYTAVQMEPLANDGKAVMKLEIQSTECAKLNAGSFQCLDAVRLLFDDVVAAHINTHGNKRVSDSQQNALTTNTTNQYYKLAFEPGNITHITVRNGFQFWVRGMWMKVKVPAQYRNKVSGLLGTFNGNHKDDLTAQHGEVLDYNKKAVEEFLDAKASQPVQSFGHSWISRNMTGGVGHKFGVQSAGQLFVNQSSGDISNAVKDKCQKLVTTALSNKCGSVPWAEAQQLILTCQYDLNVCPSCEEGVMDGIELHCH